MSKVKCFFYKLKSSLLVWGKPIIRNKIERVLLPMLLNELNSGKDNIEKRITKAVKTFTGKYL